MVIINSARSLAEFKGKLDRDFKEHKYLTVKITKSKRSNVANALQFHWYKELGEQGSETASYYRAYCKYYFGVAIRSEEDPEFHFVVREVMKLLALTPEEMERGTTLHEKRIKVISYMDVTSTFNRDQMNRYLTEIKLHFEPEGFVLTNSDDY